MTLLDPDGNRWRVGQRGPVNEGKHTVVGETLGFEQLKLLFDYTKFHITAYLTLAGAFVAVLNGAGPLKPNRILLGVSIAFIVIAGAAGGVVASNLPYHADARTFADEQIGPWCCKPMKASSWMTLEHLAFWGRSSGGNRSLRVQPEHPSIDAMIVRLLS